jgi:hypothetical protein
MAIKGGEQTKKAHAVKHGSCLRNETPNWTPQLYRLPATMRGAALLISNCALTFWIFASCSLKCLLTASSTAFNSRTFAVFFEELVEQQDLVRGRIFCVKSTRPQNANRPGDKNCGRGQTRCRSR